MLRVLVIAALAAGAMGVAPCAADAATVTNAGGTLIYLAAPGRVSRVTLVELRRGRILLARQRGDTDAITSRGCRVLPRARAVCDGVARVVADLGDGDDRVDGAHVRTVTQVLTGGAGADTLVTGARNDTLTGGEGNDFLAGNAGADTFSGGPGVDRVGYRRSGTLTVTLDGQANDGITGGHDLVGSDVENVVASGGAATTVTLVGDAGPNVLDVDRGHGLINGGAGSDILLGGPQSDTIEARDGFPDRVACGDGADTALVDQYDVVRSDCESIQRATV